MLNKNKEISLSSGSMGRALLTEEKNRKIMWSLKQLEECKGPEGKEDSII